MKNLKIFVVLFASVVSAFCQGQRVETLPTVPNFTGADLVSVSRPTGNSFANRYMPFSQYLSLLQTSLGFCTTPQQFAYQELLNAGVSSNLVDFAAFDTGYLMSNTWAGQSITFSNVIAYTQQGLYFTNTGSASFVSSIPPNNTVFIVWNDDSYNPNNVIGPLFEAVNTATTNGEVLTDGDENNSGNAEGQEMVWGLNGFNTYPANHVSYTNLVYGTIGNLVNRFDLDILQHHYTAFSCSNGVITVWEEGIPMGYYNNPTNGFNLYPTNTMNLFSLGNFCIAPPASYEAFAFGNGFGGSIESVFIFNTPCTTNLYEAALFASDWLQPWTKRRVFVTDSWGSSPFNKFNLLTAVQSLAGEGAQLIAQNQGGSGLAQFIWATNVINMFPPHGKVTLDEINIAGGVNDLFQGYTPWMEWSNLMVVVSPYTNHPGYELDDWDVYKPWVSNTVYGAESVNPNLWSNTIIFNQQILTNPQIFRNVYQRSGLITQAEMNTNRVPQLSLDGLHFNNPINGYSGIQMIAGLKVQQRTGNNPWMLPGEVQPVFSYTNVLWPFANGMAVTWSNGYR